VEDDGTGKGGAVGGRGKAMAVALAVGGVTVPAAAASPGAPAMPASWCLAADVAFEIDGRAAPLVDARRGDDVVVSSRCPTDASSR
jgi:hypothetical protein